MRRSFRIALSLGAAAACVFSITPSRLIQAADTGVETPVSIVDLSAADAMERLRKSNPEHHRAVQGILASVYELERQGKGPAAAEVIRTRFAARDFFYGNLLMISNPPQRRIEFSLGETRYRATLRLDHLKPELLPL